MRCLNCNSSFTSVDTSKCPFCGSVGPFAEDTKVVSGNNTDKVNKIKKVRLVFIIIAAVTALFAEIAPQLLVISVPCLIVSLICRFRIKSLTKVKK